MKTKNENYNIFSPYTGKLAGFVYEKNKILRACLVRKKRRKKTTNKI